MIAAPRQMTNVVENPFVVLATIGPRKGEGGTGGKASPLSYRQGMKKLGRIANPAEPPPLVAEPAPAPAVEVGQAPRVPSQTREQTD
jgi:hypothetical protein